MRFPLTTIGVGVAVLSATATAAAIGNEFTPREEAAAVIALDPCKYTHSTFQAWKKSTSISY